jgi:hypothetical protein
MMEKKPIIQGEEWIKDRQGSPLVSGDITISREFCIIDGIPPIPDFQPAMQSGDRFVFQNLITLEREQEKYDLDGEDRQV